MSNSHVSETKIPLLRVGAERVGEKRGYESLDKTTLSSVSSGKKLAEVSIANTGLIRRDILRMERDQIFHGFSSGELLSLMKKAGDIFLTDALPIPEGPSPLGENGQSNVKKSQEKQTVDSYIENLSHSTGLPQSLCRLNMQKIHHVMTHIDEVLAGLMRGLSLEIFDHGVAMQGEIEMSYFAKAGQLGVILPSNSPGVNSLWLPALIMKIPVIVKPGREDPWTPLRLSCALKAAGFPEEAIGFYPTDHQGAEVIVQSCDKAIVFGGDATVEKYADNPDVETHGTGRSKVIIGNDCIEDWKSYFNILVDSIAANGGRSCINASSIIVPKYGDEIAQALAEELVKIEPKALNDAEARLSGFANPAMAEAIDYQIESGLKQEGAIDCSAVIRKNSNLSRRIEKEGLSYLLPTVIRCNDIDHPLANTEFLFPYASVIEMPQEEILDRIGFSLVVTAITADSNWIEALLQSPDIDRLNIGKIPTSHVQWNQPHEGNLFEFLYQRRAIQRSHL